MAGQERHQIGFRLIAVTGLLGFGGKNYRRSNGYIILILLHYYDF